MVSAIDIYKYPLYIDKNVLAVAFSDSSLHNEWFSVKYLEKTFPKNAEFLSVICYDIHVGILNKVFRYHLLSVGYTTLKYASFVSMRRKGSLGLLLLYKYFI